MVYFFGHKKNTPEGVLFFEKEKEKVEKRVVAMCNAPYKRAHAPIEGKTGKRRKEITSSYANDSDRRSKRQERRT